MLVAVFIFAIIPCSINAQHYSDSDSDDNGSKGYHNNSSCISRYTDLESYILNNEDLMDDLSKLFFETGKTPTEFARITYKFQIAVDNSTNVTSDYGNDDSEFTCVFNQKTFIWSSSALHLLGPKPLF